MCNADVCCISPIGDDRCDVLMFVEIACSCVITTPSHDFHPRFANRWQTCGLDVRWLPAVQDTVNQMGESNVSTEQFKTRCNHLCFFFELCVPMFFLMDANISIPLSFDCTEPPTYRCGSGWRNIIRQIGLWQPRCVPLPIIPRTTMLSNKYAVYNYSHVRDIFRHVVIEYHHVYAGAVRGCVWPTTQSRHQFRSNVCGVAEQALERG
jgi:hypothetical protein